MTSEQQHLLLAYSVLRDCPRCHYETTRAFLAKVEDLLCDAGKHAQREQPAGQPDRSGEILALAVKTRLLRCLLEKG